MAAPYPANPLLRPAENPATRFGGIAPIAGPRIPVNALMRPRPVMPAVPPVPAVPARPMPDFSPSPVPEEERVSARVPVPKADFPEAEHKDLHEKTMGEAFDDPNAQSFVGNLYSIVRKSRPHIAPKALLETVRDAHHAVKHGFMTGRQAGAAVGRMAQLRHLQAMQTPAPAPQPETPEE